jgi:hypothetical protein
MKKSTLLASLAIYGMTSSPVSALGECGLSCCIAGATSSGVTLAQNFGLSVQYEYMDMETIREGTDEVSPEEAINRHWKMGSSYAIPTQMTMKKLSLAMATPINERFQVLGIIPYLSNDMDMRMKGPMGMTMDHTMNTVKGIGDMSVLGFYTAYTDAPIRPTQRLTLGFGLKAPTGDNTKTGSTGKYIHAMMQLGSGSWDGLLTANYMRAFYPLVLQASAFYQMTTESDEGYEFGDQFSYDLSSRYQISNFVNLGLDLHGIYAGQDEDNEGKYSNPLTSMVDNTDNTGLHSIFISPVLQYKIPNSGGSVELKYQHPLYQDVKGYQQVIDQRWLLSFTWNF